MELIQENQNESEKTEVNEKLCGLSSETLQRCYDEACRDLQHGRNIEGARQEAEWASSELEKLGLRAI